MGRPTFPLASALAMLCAAQLLHLAWSRQLHQSAAVVAPGMSQDVGPVPAGDTAAVAPTRRVVFGDACSWRAGNDDCSDGFTCVGLPSNITAGRCASEPATGTAVPLGLAKPLFYLPLTAGNLNSWPWSSRTARLVAQEGDALQPVFEPQDDSDLIDQAFRCPGQGAVLQIDNFLYGRSGRFAVNVWMRANTTPSSSGSPSNTHNYDYLVSHVNTAAGSTPTAFTPNQWALYTPAPGKPQRGIARAVLKDSNDGSAPVYLDSDGAIGDNSRAAPLPALVANVSDGDWHMLTLTTRPDYAKGFLLYVDGILAGQLPSPSATTGSSEIDGGDPLILTSPLTLCGWTPGDASRAFNGNLAHLMILDAPLTELDVKALYNQVMTGFALGQAAVLAPVSTQDLDVSPDGSTQVIQVTAPTLFDTTALFWPHVRPEAEQPTTGTAAASTSPSPDQQQATSGPQVAVYRKSSGSTCSLDLSSTTDQLEFCDVGLVCVPQRNWGLSDAGVTHSSAYYPQGVCTQPLVGVVLPETYPPTFPTPLAFFPLTGDQLGPGAGLNSWPDQSYGSAGGRSATYVVDSRFGSVLSCSRTSPPVLLQPVPYSSDGGFAINLWLRTSESQLAGQYFSYVFSHASKDVADFMTSPNQIHLYLPQTGNPFYGVSARVILRDSLSTNQGRPSMVWLDTNGGVGDDEAAEVVPDGVKIDDGEWHMLTITTLPSLLDLPGLGVSRAAAVSTGSASSSSNIVTRAPGFALYLDGILRGVLSQGATRHVSNASDAQVQITGGNPAYLTGPMTLCGRVDQQANRTFGGTLSNLMLFDTALTQTQVAQLYTSYSRQAVRYPIADTTDGGRTANRTTVDGKQCVFPLVFGGRLYNDCIYLGGILSCPTQANLSWAPCSSPDVKNIPQEDLDLRDFAVSDGSQIAPGDGEIMRFTTSGQFCLIPFVYQGNTFADCVKTNGSEFCMVPSGSMQECAPVVERPRTGPAACVDVSQAAPATKTFARCVAIKGTTMCRTPRGTWLMCAPQHATRVTMQSKKCDTPFLFKGLVRSDCVLDPNASESEQEVCQVTAGDTALPPSTSSSSPAAASSSPALQTCQPPYMAAATLQSRAPTRFTLDGQRCVAPGPGALSECLDYDGTGVPTCETNTGAVFQCAPSLRNGSLTNSACAFPFLYRGFNRTDCVWLDGIEACKTTSGRWEECKPWVMTVLPDPPDNTTARFSVQGTPCALPYNLQGMTLWDCVGSNETQPGYCRTADGSWQSCAPLDTRNTRSTAAGDPCVLPYQWQGATYYDCMGSDAIAGSPGVCLNGQGQFVACAPRPRYGVVTGRQCVFPATWRGRVVNDCVIGPLPWWQSACNVDAGNAYAWEACAPVYPDPSAAGGVDAGSSQVTGRDTVPDSTTALGLPVSTSNGDKNRQAGDAGGGNGGGSSKKQRDLALGLVFGLGGGVLLLAVLLGAGRRAWQRSHRARVMREMGFSGPGAGPGGGGGGGGGGGLSSSSAWPRVKPLEVPDYSPASMTSPGGPEVSGPSSSAPSSLELGKASAYSLPYTSGGGGARLKELSPFSPQASPTIAPVAAPITGPTPAPIPAPAPVPAGARPPGVIMTALPGATTHAERLARFREATGLGTGTPGQLPNPPRAASTTVTGSSQADSGTPVSAAGATGGPSAHTPAAVTRTGSTPAVATSTGGSVKPPRPPPPPPPNKSSPQLH